jgi:hypothetical protein
MPQFTKRRSESGETGLGRKAALFVFWMLGFIIGAAAWLVRTPLIQFIEGIGLGSYAAQGIVAGLFGSSVMVLAVLSWSFLSGK